jgi:hypothetical protein
MFSTLLKPTRLSPGGCSGQRACPHAQLGIPETAHGPPLEHHQLPHGSSTHSLTHTLSWVYRRRLTGRLWNTTSCLTAAPLTHSLTRPAGCTGDGSRAASGTPPAASRPLHSLTHTPSWVYRRRLTGRLWNTTSCLHSAVWSRHDGAGGPAPLLRHAADAAAAARVLASDGLAAFRQVGFRRYRRLGIQGGQGRGGLAHRFTVQAYPYC